MSQPPPLTYKISLSRLAIVSRSTLSELKTKSKTLSVGSFIDRDSHIMTSARDIAQRPAKTVSHSLSISPTATFQSPLSSHSFQAGGTLQTKQLKPFNTGDIKILLLENVNQSGIEILKAQGYQVEALKSSLPADELIEKIRCVTRDPPSFGGEFSEARETPCPSPLTTTTITAITIMLLLTRRQGTFTSLASGQRQS